jgi:hypothetical protein
MKDHVAEADYVIIGAGAAAMAFADTILSESDATMVLVDRRHRPGGHWNDAYPFIRLHSPAFFYGVNSASLGGDRIDAIGLNRGHLELATGSEICGYFDQVMQHRFLPSGRIKFLPLHDYGEGGFATSRLSGEKILLVARRKIVDTTYTQTQVPSTHPPKFPVAPGVILVAPNDLPKIDQVTMGFVVIGAGKTSIDTVLWLLEQNVPPENITWIRPRDCWLYNRALFQPRFDLAEGTIGGMVDEMEAAIEATSPDELFDRLEARQALFRIDTEVRPTMFHCATITVAELEAVRQVRNVVRLGRVTAIGEDHIRLEHGEIPTSSRHVHINCTADGVPVMPTQPIFQNGLIVPQFIQHCWPVFSAAFIAFLEIRRQDDVERNRLAMPIPMADEPLDWLRGRLFDEHNANHWAQHADIEAWKEKSRLESFTRMFAEAGRNPTPAVAALLKRFAEVRPAGLAKIAALLQAA